MVPVANGPALRHAHLALAAGGTLWWRLGLQRTAPLRVLTGAVA